MMMLARPEPSESAAARAAGRRQAIAVGSQVLGLHFCSSFRRCAQMALFYRAGGAGRRPGANGQCKSWKISNTTAAETTLASLCPCQIFLYVFQLLRSAILAEIYNRNLISEISCRHSVRNRYEGCPSHIVHIW